MGIKQLCLLPKIIVGLKRIKNNSYSWSIINAVF